MRARGVGLVVLLAISATASAANLTLPASVTSAPPEAQAPPPPPADVPPPIDKDPNGLEFDVHLPQQQRSLRDHDAKFEHMMKTLPDLDPNNSVPFKKAWTENVVDSFNSQLKNGPDPKCESHECVGSEMAQQRVKQLNTDFGPEDDWTWTPPSQ
jgi:hypothetical protein